MVYKEVPIELLKDNPFQTREPDKTGKHKEKLVGLATSAADHLGIRNAPIVRPNPNGDGTYQIGSGHRRRDIGKLLGHKTIMVRIEPMTDEEMMKEVLVENIHRLNFNEKETFDSLEQIRKAKGWKKEDHGFLTKMGKETGMAHITLADIYEVADIRIKLKVVGSNKSKQPHFGLIRETRGLPEAERLRLIVKATEMDMGAQTTRLVTKALKQMNPEVRDLILSKNAQLTRKTIEAIGTITDVETQKETVKFIVTHGYNEDLALRFIDRAKQGNLTVNVTVLNEPDRVMQKIRFGYDIIAGWGVNEKQILGIRWGEAVSIFDKMEKKIAELKRL